MDIVGIICLLLFPGGTMLISLLLAFREGLEAALVVGILLSIIRKIQLKGLKPEIWWGVAAAVVASVGVAIGLNVLGASLEGTAEKLYEGFSLLIAAVLLTFMIVWVSRTSRELQKGYETSLQAAATTNRKMPVFWLVFVSVFREGIELAIFLLAVSFASSALTQISGVVLGLAIAVFLIWIWYRSVQNLTLGKFFLTTNILFAAGLMTRAAHEFIELGWLPTIVQPLYNLNPILNESSQLGSILRSLFGYTSAPALIETLVYIGYLTLALFFFVFKLKGGQKLHHKTEEAASGG
jgi:high-affinity iron transporter